MYMYLIYKTLRMQFMNTSNIKTGNFVFATDNFTTKDSLEVCLQPEDIDWVRVFPNMAR